MGVGEKRAESVLLENWGGGLENVSLLHFFVFSILTLGF